MLLLLISFSFINNVDACILSVISEMLSHTYSPCPYSPIAWNDCSCLHVSFRITGIYIHAKCILQLLAKRTRLLTLKNYFNLNISNLREKSLQKLILIKPIFIFCCYSFCECDTHAGQIRV